MVPFKRERQELIRIGRIAFEAGLTDTHGGNISMRVDDYILIKKSGKMLGFLKEEDFILTTLEANERLDRFASVELKVHRALYKELPGISSVLHTHAPYTVAASLKFDRIVPLDSEGKLLLGEVPVLKAQKVVSSDEVAERLPELLKSSPVAVVWSHGPFAVGKTPEEALMFISALENSCKILSAYYSLRG
ncbi:MAG: aldolase [Thermovibrio sp.]|nr:MAG: aldolase [Thermovibrio sp.]